MQDLYDKMAALTAERLELLDELNACNAQLRDIKSRQQNARSLNEQTRNDDIHKRTLARAYAIQNRLSAIKGLLALCNVQKDMRHQQAAQARRDEALRNGG